jgi:hypothetical protein
VRPGHHRPLGTTTTMRFPHWPPCGREPQLGDVALQTSGPRTDDAQVVLRAYRVVGVIEGRKPNSYRLVMERIGSPDAAGAPDGTVWTFYNEPRR